MCLRVHGARTRVFRRLHTFKSMMCVLNFYMFYDSFMLTTHKFTFALRVPRTFVWAHTHAQVEKRIECKRFMYIYAVCAFLYTRMHTQRKQATKISALYYLIPARAQRRQFLFERARAHDGWLKLFMLYTHTHTTRAPSLSSTTHSLPPSATC